MTGGREYDVSPDGFHRRQRTSLCMHCVLQQRHAPAMSISLLNSRLGRSLRDLAFFQACLCNRVSSDTAHASQRKQWPKGFCALSALDCCPFSIVLLLCALDKSDFFFVDCSLDLEIFNQLYHHSSCISAETTLQPTQLTNQSNQTPKPCLTLTIHMTSTLPVTLR